MQNIFEASTARELTDRINRLSPDSQRQWGKMNVAQMMAHTCLPMEVALGEKEGKRTLMGRLIGPLVKKIVTDEKPFKQSLPTNPDFIIVDEKDFNTEKQRLIAVLGRFSKAGEKTMESRRHPFFGKLTGKEWSNAMVKHLDHHLRQFGG